MKIAGDNGKRELKETVRKKGFCKCEAKHGSCADGVFKAQ